jgi:hypothetical protein
MSTIREGVEVLQQHIRENAGRNAASASFVAEVNRLLSAFYDDIGRISVEPLAALLRLFLIKTLYVERASRDPEVLDYLTDMLERYLVTRELAPYADQRKYTFYLSDLLNEMEHPSGTFQNAFEAYKRYADNALFLTGVFPRAFRRRRGGQRLGAPSAWIDAPYFISTGKTYYRQAAGTELAEWVELRTTLEKLALYFEIYMDALNELSDRYVMGFDMELLADKMLDAFNAYRETGEERHLESARKYAALLNIDRARFPALSRQRRPRGYLLGNG